MNHPVSRRQVLWGCLTGLFGLRAVLAQARGGPTLPPPALPAPASPPVVAPARYDPLSRITTYSYDAGAWRLEADGPGAAGTYSYDRAGPLRSLDAGKSKGQAG